MENYIFLFLMGSFFSTLTHASELEVSWVYEPEDIAYNPDLSWAGGYVDPVVSSPVLDEENLYFSTYSGSVLSLAAETGEVRWRSNVFGSASWGAFVDKQYFFVGEGVESQQRMAAVDKNSGHTVWLYEYPNQYQLSYPIEYNGFLLFVSYEYIFCLNIESGELAWKYPVHGMKGRPIVSDGVIYYQDNTQILYSIDIETGRLDFEVVHDGREYDFGSLEVLEDNVYLTIRQDEGSKAVSYDKKTSELLWQHDLGGAVLTDITASGDLVYFSVESDDLAEVVALDRYDGHEVWRHELKGYARHKFNFDDRYMYFGAGKDFYVLDKLTGHEVVSHTLDKTLYTEARVDGEMIFIGTFEGEVYALKLLSP